MTKHEWEAGRERDKSAGARAMAEVGKAIDEEIARWAKTPETEAREGATTGLLMLRKRLFPAANVRPAR